LTPSHFHIYSLSFLRKKIIGFQEVNERGNKMISSDIKTVCIKRMKDIIGVYGENSGLIQASKENVEKTLQEIFDVKIIANAIFSTSVKNALYNLENFRPEIRSALELQLFNVWHNAFKTVGNEQSDDIEPEILSSVVMAAVSEVEEILEEPAVVEGPEAGAEEILEEPAVAEEPEPEAEETVEEKVLVQIPETLEKELPNKSLDEQEQQAVEKKPESLEELSGQADEAEVSLKRHSSDWFDLILDMSAAMMKFFTRILLKKRS